MIQALHKAVDDQAVKASFHGYMPECGDPELRRTIAGYYKKRNADLSPEEVFISSGASDELGDILDLFGRDKKVMIMEPAIRLMWMPISSQAIRSYISHRERQRALCRSPVKGIGRM